MPTALQKITYRIHGQRKLLVPSIMLRRGYIETAHLGQINSELQTLQGRGLQLHGYNEATVSRLLSLPNYDKLTPEELHRHSIDILNSEEALSGRMNLRTAHLKAVKKQITQFKLN